MANTDNIDNLLRELRACDEAQKWAQGKSWSEIHATCHRGDWLLWLFKKTNPDDLQRLTLAKGHCAKTVLHLMKDDRSRKAVEVAIAFGEGTATRADLNAAAAAADAAAHAAIAAAADAAAYAAIAAAAADAAYAAIAAIAAAADAYAAAHAYAAHAADVDAARAKNQLETADICRKYLPIEIFNI
jgi:hypothetical protein